MYFAYLKDNFKKLLILVLLLQGFNPFVIASDADQESIPFTSPSSPRQEYIHSKGYFNVGDENLKNVRVQSYLSLGDSFISKISKLIKNSDQFTLAFMYRFNSPILLESFRKKSRNSVVFLDRNQCYKNENKESYNGFIKELIEKVPTSLIDLKSKSFHQKIIICKNEGEQAYTIIGSANATFEAENKHSEDFFLSKAMH